MSIITCSNNNKYPDFTDWCNISNVTDEINSVDWVIYKRDDVDDDDNPIIRYDLCIGHMTVYRTGWSSCLRYFNIISSSDDIQFDISEDKSICKITTDKYIYEFKKSDFLTIKNNIGGVYRTNDFENISITKLTKLTNSDKYYLELDNDVLSLYVDNNYLWSKIISKKYTEGVYFICKDKVFCVIANGRGILDIFNIDGSIYKNIQTSMDYIERVSIKEDDKQNKYLVLTGFIWNPIYVVQYIDLETVLSDRIKQKTYIEKYNPGDNKLNLGDEDFSYEDMRYDEE
jgi:hypothetical protein